MAAMNRSPVSESSRVRAMVVPPWEVAMKPSSLPGVYVPTSQASFPPPVRGRPQPGRQTGCQCLDLDRMITAETHLLRPKIQALMRVLMRIQK
jgi:hypothetical protein